MHLLGLYSINAYRFAAILSIVVCAGCWQEIEYTGPRTTSTQPPPADVPPTATEPPASAARTSERPAASSTTSVVEQTTVTSSSADSSPAAAPPTTATAVAEATTPKPEGERYATPPVAENAATNPPQPAAEAEKSTASPPAEPAARHTDATATSATADAAPPANALNSRRAAWLLGSRLSLAALANDRGVAAKNVPVWMEDARTAAKYLGTSIGDLPEPASASDGSPASRQVINFLLVNGQRIGSELSKQHGPEQSALFEIALKSNILLLLYNPGSSAGNSVAAAISQAAPQAKLPAEYWQPVVEALGKQVPQSGVRATIRKMHIDVDRHLAQTAEQDRR